jgi:hypothetical protein
VYLCSTHTTARVLNTALLLQPIAGTGSSRPSKTERRDLVRADAVQLEIDPSVTWSSIGGLGRHVRALKEMVQLPLVYPEVFARFGAEVSHSSCCYCYLTVVVHVSVIWLFINFTCSLVLVLLLRVSPALHGAYSYIYNYHY